MKIVYGTVVYESARNYLPDYIDSLNEQTFKEFDVFIVNDDIKIDELQPELSRLRYQYILEQNVCHYNPIELRIQLIKEAKKKDYDLLIIGDCDDKFSANRVKEVVYNYEEKVDFYYNELLDFEGHPVMDLMPDCTKDINDILESNYLGLSNLALNLHSISEEFLISMEDSVRHPIFDWYFVSRFLNDGKYGKKIKHAYTYYRFHENNTVGQQKFSSSQIKKELSVKIEHYHLLSKYNPVFQTMYELYEKLNAKTEQNEELLSPYIIKNNYWWGMIQITGRKTMKEER